MTGRENLEMVVRLFGQDRPSAKGNVERVLAQLRLDEDADRLVREYSGGMRRKVDLGASLVGTPRLLLFDEPTTGVDPRSRIDLWDAIRDLVGRGTNVLLTTQYLDETDHLADQIVIIDHGKAMAQGTPSELKKRTGRNVIEVHVGNREDVGEAARVFAGIGDGDVSTDESTRQVSVVVKGGMEQLGVALHALQGAAIAVDDVALRPPRLDEAFLELTGQSLQEQSTDGRVMAETTQARAPKFRLIGNSRGSRLVAFKQIRHGQHPKSSAGAKRTSAMSFGRHHSLGIE